MTKNEVIKVIYDLKNVNNLSEYTFGLAGSFAREDNTSKSDIDIVVNTDGMPIKLINLIKNSFLGIETDVLCLGLLKKEDEELDEFLMNMGLPINDESVYKTVSNEVIWIE